MSFLVEQPVSARIVIRRQGERVVMMLAEEEEDDTEPIDSSTAVTEIGGTKYASLPEAFAAASNYDDTITLLNNTELAEPLSVPLNDHYISHFTLDLNSKTISCNNGNSDTLFVCATLIICDSSSEKQIPGTALQPCRERLREYEDRKKIESYSSPRASRSASSFMIAGYFLSS